MTFYQVNVQYFFPVKKKKQTAHVKKKKKLPNKNYEKPSKVYVTK